MIQVALSFYTRGREKTVWESMPQVPSVGDTVHYNPDKPADADGSRAWRVLHVSWVTDTYNGRDGDGWHAEIGLE